MPSTEVPSSRRAKSKHKSHRSRSHRTDKDHDAPTILQTVIPDGPTTLEDLRKARLVYLEASPEERSRKMKYEYSRKVPVKSATATSETSSRRRSKGRSKKAVGSRRVDHVKTTQPDDTGDDADDDNDGFVYLRRGLSSQKQQTEALEESKQPETTSKDVRMTSTASGRQGTHRKPSTQRIQSPSAEIRITECLPSSTSRPSLRRSSTGVPSSTRPPVLRNARSELPKVDSEVSSIRPPSQKTTSGMFGGLFTRKAPPIQEAKVSCLTCGDDVVKSRSARLPCSHRMCQSCLKRIFKLSVTDPAHMPPKCCTDQHIDLRHVDKLFDDDFKKNWNKKFKEYKAKNRIYCPKKGCGQWIQPKHIVNDKGRKTGKCPTCKTYVCATCNQKMHKSRDCPKDPATKQFVEIAKKEGWQKCYNCSATVELKEGCNHMTCRCTAEFCMVCGSKWKSCDCPWFSYEQVDINGDPVRYQQELDRRQEQEHRDAELARRMEVLDMDNVVNVFWRLGNRGGIPPAQLNHNFFEQAREALTANYQVADQAARGILHGFFPARANTINDHVPLPPPIPLADETPDRPQRTRRRHSPNDPAESPIIEHTPVELPAARRGGRRRRQLTQDFLEELTPADPRSEQQRRMRQWADDMPDLAAADNNV